MDRIVIGGLGNPVDHRVLNALLTAEDIPGFTGTSSLTRWPKGEGWEVGPRYVVVKTDAELTPEMEASIRVIVLTHVAGMRAEQG